VNGAFTRGFRSKDFQWLRLCERSSTATAAVDAEQVKVLMMFSDSKRQSEFVKLVAGI
jgi:hypothetical protein